MYKVNERVLFGAAGGLLVVASALAGTYYVVSTRSDARAATPSQTRPTEKVVAAPKAGAALDAFVARSVEVKTGNATTKKTWAELGVEIDPDELARAGSVPSDKELAALAKR